MPYLPPEQKFANYKPHLGDTVRFMGVELGKVVKIEGAICYVEWGDGLEQPFIWCFSDGLNALHEWPQKRGGPSARLGRY